MKCNEFRTKLEEIKFLKKEFDLELGKVRETKNTDIAIELQKKVWNGIFEVSEMLDSDLIKLREKYAQKYDAVLVGGFHDGCAFVKVSDMSSPNKTFWQGEGFFIDKFGNKINDEMYPAEGSPLDVHFSEGLARVKSLTRSKDIYETYYIDTLGNRKITGSFKNTYEFHNGFALVQTNYDEGYFFMDKSGEKSSRNFESAKSFSEGLAAVEIDGKWHFVDASFNVVLGGFVEAKSFSDGLALIKTVDEKYIFINKEGKQAFDGEFDSAQSFNDGWALVKEDGKYCFIDTSGEKVFEDEFVLTPFYEGFSSKMYVEKDAEGKKSIKYVAPIDKWGNILPHKSHDMTVSFHDGVAEITDENRNNYFINKKGQRIFEKQK